MKTTQRNKGRCEESQENDGWTKWKYQEKIFKKLKRISGAECTITKMKNSLGYKSMFEQADVVISELEDRTMEVIKSKE